MIQKVKSGEVFSHPFLMIILSLPAKIPEDKDFPILTSSDNQFSMDMYHSCSLGIVMEVLYYHLDGMIKKYKWKGQLGLRNLSGNWLFSLPTQERFIIFLNRQYRSKLVDRRSSYDTGTQRILMSRRLLLIITGLALGDFHFTFGNLNFLRKFCSPWGKLVEIHLATMNFTKLNSCKLLVRCDLKKVSSAI